MITVIDNFLKKEHFEHIRDWALSNELQWTYSPSVADDSDVGLGYFVHVLYKDLEPKSKWITEGMIAPLMESAKMEILIRAKLNLYPATHTIKYHKPHTDLPYSHKAAVYCLNTCDGGTTIGKRKIDSVANRIIFFDGNEDHYSSTCTDQPVRININFNWLTPHADNNKISK